MAFETGSLSGGDDLEDLIEKIHDFALADGWTIDSSFTSGDLDLQMHVDQCFLNLLGTKSATLNDSTGSTASATSPDYRLEARLGESTTPVTVSGNQRVITNDMKGPYATYWLFSGDVGDPKYIHFVVQKSNGRFSSMSFGNIDKKGATFTGGAFLIGYFWDWSFNLSSYPGFGSSGEGSDITSGNHVVPFTDRNSSFSAYNIYLGALTATNKVIADYSGNSFDVLTPLMLRNNVNLSGMNGSNARWLGPIFFLGPNPVNGVSPMFEIPLLWQDSTNSRLRLVGTIPGLRWVSMKGRTEAETVTFSTDTYNIFPFKRALTWTPESAVWASRTVTSGPYGFAVKKIE